jgi:hypothetical protein
MIQNAVRSYDADRFSKPKTCQRPPAGGLTASKKFGQHYKCRPAEATCAELAETLFTFCLPFFLPCSPFAYLLVAFYPFFYYTIAADLI